jgi:hypothetical protein
MSVLQPSAPTVDLLSWLAAGTRTYAEAIDAWQSHCPRLTIWEDAIIGGLIRIDRSGDGSVVRVTGLGRQALAEAGLQA